MTSPTLNSMLKSLVGEPEKSKKDSPFVAVYCQNCGFIDEKVSKVAIRVITQMTQQPFAVIDCQQCGSKINVNLEEDTMKIGKNGKVKLKDTTKW